MTVLSKTRSALTISGGVVRKQYDAPSMAAAEICWYQQVPWACPRLIDADPEKGYLIIEFGRPAQDHPDMRPAGALAELLYALHDMTIHHRDVHVGNVVFDRTGQPLLIDWETAIRCGGPSYDLHGPLVSGVPVPEIHTVLPSGYTMWWGSAHYSSIRNRWGCDVPTDMGERPRARQGQA